MEKKIPALTPLAIALSLITSAVQAASPADAAGAANAKDLDTIEVHGKRHAEPDSPKFTHPLLDTPQSVTVVPAELMQQQGVTSLRDALRNVPGISMQAGEGGYPAGDNLSLRGFSARTDLFVDGIRDISGYSRDPFNLEQVEVVKGPSSTHSGRGSTGGSVNLSSKVARTGEFINGTLGIGDNSLVRATADINRPLGDSSAFRINLLGHSDEINGRDAIDNERWGVAPSLSFGLGGDTTTSIGLFHLEQDNMPDYGQPWVPASNNVLVESRNRTAPVDRGNWYGLLDRDYEDTTTDMATVSVDHRFSDGLSLRNVTRYGRSSRDSIITAPRFVSDDSTDINRSAKTRDSVDRILANVTDLTATFSTGSIGHILLAGLELSSEESSNRTRSVSNGDPADLFNPDFNAPYTGTITVGDKTTVDADSAAVYLFDTLVLNPQWELSGGLRWDRFAVDTGELERTDSMLSGRAAVTFKPRENGSVYLGFGTSFNPSAEGLSLNSRVADADPEESRTLELGTKWNLFGEKLMLTSAIFRTEKTDARTTDPADPDRLQVLEGEQRVDGFEIGLAGRINEQWTLYGGYAWLDSEITESLNPDEIGNELGNTPRNSASLWTTYAPTDTLSFGFGVQHVGARYSNTSNTRQAKSYTLYDAMVSYRFSPAFALRLNGYNLSNKFHVDRVGGGHYVPGAERTLMLSADVSF
jgi:catecholate siderophore receptor